MGLMDILNQALGSGRVTDQHVDDVVRQAPGDVVASGLSHVFRSDQTPPVGDMVGQMYGHSNGQQQAGLLNQILGSLGPAAAGSLAGGVLGRILTPGSTQVTPAQASQLSPQDVTQVVEQASRTDPGIVDGMARFYADHAGLIKTIGGAALVMALAKMKDHVNQR